MPQVPEDTSEYKRPATFSEEAVPAGPLRDHRTKAGVGAKIVVEARRLEYTLEFPYVVVDARLGLTTSTPSRSR
jgi:tellurite resistance-related uncharacterized protein